MYDPHIPPPTIRPDLRARVNAQTRIFTQFSYNFGQIFRLKANFGIKTGPEIKSDDANFLK